MTAAELRRAIEELLEDAVAEAIEPGAYIDGYEPAIRRVLDLLPSEGAWVTEAALAEALHGTGPLRGGSHQIDCQRDAAAILARLFPVTPQGAARWGAGRGTAGVSAARVHAASGAASHGNVVLAVRRGPAMNLE